MTDAELRGKLLKVFYDRRHNASGWVPTSDIDTSGGEFVGRQVIDGICGQLADVGLIQWKPHTGVQEGFVIGMAKITATGIDVIDGTRPPPIAINIIELPPRGIDLYDALLADAKKLGPDEAKLVEVVGRERTELLLTDAIKRQATSSFVTDSHGVSKIPRNLFDLIEAELKRVGVAIESIAAAETAKPPVSARPSGTTLIPPASETGRISANAAGFSAEPAIEPAPERANLLPTEPDHATLDADLPDLPPQGPGPHFELTKTGVIDFVPPEALDRKGNNVGRLRRLHPTLRDLARQLAQALGTGNIPHAHLASRIEEYRKRVDQTLDTIDFTLLYVEGVRLANAEKATIEKVAEGELPPLRETDREKLETLLQLHGTFMLATIAGAELIAAEQRYRRRPAEEREYRAAAVDFAASLQNQPDVINPDTAAFVLGAAEQIGHGANPERSGVVGTTTVLNVAITLAAVAAVPGLPFMGNLIAGTPGLIAGGAAAYITSEVLKRSTSFAAVIAPIIAKLDREVDFRKFKNFLLYVEEKARHLAKYNDQLSWLNTVLDLVRPVYPVFNIDLFRRVDDDELGLSNRILEVLQNDNIVYLGDLVQKTVAEMILTPNCTRSIVNELSESLASIGLHLGMELQGWPPENIEDFVRKLSPT